MHGLFSRPMKKFQSTRSQDRDSTQLVIDSAVEYFNPLGRKTETAKLNNYLLFYHHFSIHTTHKILTHLNFNQFLDHILTNRSHFQVRIPREFYVHFRFAPSFIYPIKPLSHLSQVPLYPFPKLTANGPCYPHASRIFHRLYTPNIKLHHFNCL